ncbi:MAG: hypothetical protein WC101_04535 [Candidatus Gracilibacteria bacterium]
MENALRSTVYDLVAEITRSPAFTSAQCAMLRDFAFVSDEKLEEAHALMIALKEELDEIEREALTEKLSTFDQYFSRLKEITASQVRAGRQYEETISQNQDASSQANLLGQLNNH